MDISVSSNFERLMFDLYDRDPAAVDALMAQFSEGAIDLSAAALERARALFMSERVDDEATLACIADTWKQLRLSSRSAQRDRLPAARAGARADANSGPWVTLATAHPAKFPEAIERAGVATSAALPAHLADLYEREEHADVLPCDLAAVQRFMAGHLGA
jgi:threonine synthase